jgi:hypothetical protein
MLRVLSILIAMLVACGPVHAADTTYRDPRQPSFTLLVPQGWKAQPNEQGVVLSRDDSYFMLCAMAGATTPGAMLVQLRPQFEQQWKPFRELEAGRVVFGGKDGAYVVYAGVPPSGIESTTRIVVMTDGRLTYVAFEGTPVASAPQRKPELERIERSFASDPVR